MTTDTLSRIIESQNYKIIGKDSNNPLIGKILTPEAIKFLSLLHQNFEKPRQERLRARIIAQEKFDGGQLPDFLIETADIRSDDWKVAPIPKDLQDRRVEITGPTDRKMVINALNSGAKIFMADFEDANSPSLLNCIEGQDRKSVV